MRELLAEIRICSRELQLACEALHWYVRREKISYTKQHNTSESLLQGVDPERLMLLSAQHGLHGILGCFFENFYAGAPITSKFCRQREGYALKNLALFAVQERLLGSLERAGFSATVLKGSVLAHKLYYSVADRSIADIDLRVEERDWFKLKRVLEEAGFVPRYSLSDEQWQALVSRGVSVVFCPLALPSISNPLETRINLDLHFAGDDQFHFVDYERIGGLSADEALLLYLIDHAAKHTWFRLIWLTDIALLIDRSKEIRLTKLLANAETGNGLYALNYCLQLLQTIGLMHGIESSSPMTMAHLRGLRYVISRWDRETSPWEFFPRNFFLHLLMGDNWSKRLKYLRWRTFELSEQDYLAAGVESRSLWRYYVIRLFRLTAQRVTRLVFTAFNSWKRPIASSKAQ